jgi:hypothetical protein
VNEYEIIPLILLSRLKAGGANRFTIYDFRFSIVVFKDWWGGAATLQNIVSEFSEASVAIIRTSFFFFTTKVTKGTKFLSRCSAFGCLRLIRFSRWYILRNHNEICDKMNDCEWNKNNRDAENQQQKATSMPLPFCYYLHS